MTWLILYLIGVFVAWFLSIKICTALGWKWVSGLGWYTMDEHGKTDKFKSDFPPVAFGVVWPAVLIVCGLYWFSIGIGKTFKTIDKKMWGLASSINIKVEKKDQ